MVTRHLDFIVFGVPRSGTTALVKALNLHADIFCGVERFHFETPPHVITFPDSFRNRKFIASAANLARTIEYLDAKGDGVAFAGDKCPRYYCALEKWQALGTALKTIAVYRSPYEYLASWRRRADSASDQWPAQQVGLFGIVELFALLRNSLDYAPGTLFVPYNACFFDNPETIRRVIEHVGADPKRYDHERFLRSLFAQPKRNRQRPALPRDEVDLLEAANIESFDRILLRENAFVIGDFKQQIEDCLADVPADFAILAEHWLAERRSWSLRSFLTTWAGHFQGMQQLPNAAAAPPTLVKHAALATALHRRMYRRVRTALRVSLHRWRVSAGKTSSKA